jgi:hypothetical protein
MKVKEITAGIKFGRLTTIKEVHKSIKKRYAWFCRCECGNEKIVIATSLIRKNTMSCGCLHREQLIARNKQGTVHGDSRNGQRIYRIWHSMRERCLTPTCKDYKNYGGRGITICNEWNSYINFKKWALENGYSDILSIDRINVDGNYEPSNCRWATSKQQANNRRKRRVIYEIKH